MTRSASRTRRTGRMLQVAGVGAAALLALSACSSDSDSSTKSDSTKSGSSAKSDKLSGTVTVFAAASLKESFTTLGKDFEKAHPGTKVTFNFGGSDTLAAGDHRRRPGRCVRRREPEDDGHRDGQERRGRHSGRLRAQPAGDRDPARQPGQGRLLKDLTKSGLKVVLCDKTVPCGAAAQKALDASSLKLTPVSYEQDVKSALTKVELKEADAAVVYKTDVNAAGDKVEGVEFPESAKAINDYPIVLLKDAPNAAAAKEFIALVQSPEGQKVLTAAGFLQP